MNYYYLSGVSHIPHFLQIQKKVPDLIAVSLSNDVAKYFLHQQCFKPLLEDTHLISKKIPINILDSSAKNFISQAPISSFIFNERLIDLNGVYYAKTLVKLGVKTVIYWDDINVTNFYKFAKIRHLTIWMWFSWLKNFIRYKFLPIRWYETHDGIYLGVSKKYLVNSGMGIKEYPDQHGWNPFFRGGAFVEKKSEKIDCKIVIALGYSIFDDSRFFNHNHRVLIYRDIIKKIPNVFVKYHPQSIIKNEFPDVRELHRAEVIESYADQIYVLISDYSLSLINMSQLGVKTISVLDMLAVADQEKYFFWKEYLSLSGHNIFFPKNMDELIEICKRGSNE
jgi:hypothetical protein